MTEATIDPTAQLTVGQVADTYGVTVRTLHHYDQVGLLQPSDRSSSGYRLYTSADLARLQQIVVYRRLGFSLADVAQLLTDVEARGDDAAVQHLRRQRAAVMSQLAQMHRLVRAIDSALERAMSKKPATTADLKELFGDGYSDEHQADAQERWDGSPQSQQNRERRSRLTAQDWAEIKAESDALDRDLAAALAAGEPPSSQCGAQLAERHRATIGHHYDCSPDFQVTLAQLYLSDPQFTQHYEDIHPGLAQWLHDAIVANASHHG